MMRLYKHGISELKTVFLKMLGSAMDCLLYRLEIFHFFAAFICSSDFYTCNHLCVSHFSFHPAASRYSAYFHGCSLTFFKSVSDTHSFFIHTIYFFSFISFHVPFSFFDCWQWVCPTSSTAWRFLSQYHLTISLSKPVSNSLYILLDAFLRCVIEAVPPTPNYQLQKWKTRRRKVGLCWDRLGSSPVRTTCSATFGLSNVAKLWPSQAV